MRLLARRRRRALRRRLASRRIRKYAQTILGGIVRGRANPPAMPQKIEIELSSEERTELQRLARSETRPFREVQRARMILYSADGLIDARIAERLDCTPECV